MNTHQKYQAYAAATQTVARTKQIVMLYEGIIRFLQQAKEAMDENRIEDRYTMLSKSSEILLGLQACLDFDNGGEIAKILYNYYSTIDAQIYQLHRSNNAQECTRIISELKKMRDVWAEIDGSNTDASAAKEESTALKKPDGNDSVTISA